MNAPFLYGEIYMRLSLMLLASVSALLCSGALAADCLSVDTGRMAKDKSYQKSVMASCLASKDKAEAQYMLGTIYYDGAGVRKNIGEAEKWFRKAALQGHSDAQNELGVLYSMGDGEWKNCDEAE